MKVLLDACVWSGAVQDLRDRGHDVDWVGAWPIDPGDTEILASAYDDGSVLVTLDKDFGELAVLHGEPHHGIVRLVGLRAREQGPRCADALAQCESELAAGALVTVGPTRIRVRRRGDVP